MNGIVVVLLVFFIFLIESATSADVAFDGPEKPAFYHVDYCGKQGENCNRFWLNLRYPGEKAPLDFRLVNPPMPAYALEGLSKSYRLLAVLDLKPFNFSFEFYHTQISDRVVISTGGFLHIGDLVNSEHLTQSQYIAPLMANFDFSLEHSDPTRKLIYFINKSMLVVEWRNVSLQEYPTEPFTFQAQIYRNGTIVLAYFTIPIEISRFSKKKHPVKVGISDGYFKDESILSRKKNSSRLGVNFRVKLTKYSAIDVNPIMRHRRPTAFIFRPNKNVHCSNFQTCGTCLSGDEDVFNEYDIDLAKLRCTWCPTLRKCSSGFDRRRQSWLNARCHWRNVSILHRCSFSENDPVELRYFDNYDESSVEGSTSQVLLNTNEKRIDNVTTVAIFSANSGNIATLPQSCQEAVLFNSAFISLMALLLSQVK